MSGRSRHYAPENDMVPDVTLDDLILFRQIKKSVQEGHDVEIRKAPDGRLKVLEVSKKNIAVG